MSHSHPAPPDGRMDTEDVKHSTSMMYVKKPHNNVMVTAHELHHAAGKSSDMLFICAGTFCSQVVHPQSSLKECAFSKVTSVLR